MKYLTDPQTALYWENENSYKSSKGTILLESTGNRMPDRQIVCGDFISK